jgi:hypothetical protein
VYWFNGFAVYAVAVPLFVAVVRIIPDKVLGVDILPRRPSSQGIVLVFETVDCYEYIVLVTNTELELSAVAQAYRDRADCENVFDEIKNQRGWGGFVTQDLRRCRIMARLIALVCKWF